jgi:aryl-alcohol dehydrogenase-like predicted oxidoreductase
MPLNSYVTLGRSGLRVSPFCLGAMTFGEDSRWHPKSDNTLGSEGRELPVVTAFG